MNRRRDNQVAKVERWVHQPPRQSASEARRQVHHRLAELLDPKRQTQWRLASLATAVSLIVLFLTAVPAPPPRPPVSPKTTTVVFELATGTDLFFVLSIPGEP